MKLTFMVGFGLGSALAGALFAALVVVFVFPVALGYPVHSAQHEAHQITAIPLCSKASDSPRSSFYSETAEINARMHERMAIVPAGDVNRDFVRMMIPHHQGAIDMALALLRHEPDERLRRLAQSIIVEQQQEIIYMRLLDGNQWTTSFTSVPTTNQ
jgi:uncharacterized protein (DUF305 family)